MEHSTVRVFFWGQVAEGTTAKARRDALVSLGCQVETGSTWDLIQGAGRFAYHAARRLGLGPLVNSENRAILATALGPYDIIWIEKGIFLRESTIRLLKKRCRTLIHFTPDHAFNSKTKTRHFLKCLPHYDVCGTTKPEEVYEYKHHMGRGVLLLPKSYNPDIHRPYPQEELSSFCSTIGFIGVWTAEKERVLRMVIDAFPDEEIRIWGPVWRRKVKDPEVRRRFAGASEGIYGKDYGRILAATAINLGLLANDVTQHEVITDRILEIPACGALLIAPRTPEIAAIFRDGKEALLFGSDQELLEKLRWALEHEEERRTIAARGHERVLAGPYRDQDVVARVLEEAMALMRKEAL